MPGLCWFIVLIHYYNKSRKYIYIILTPVKPSIHYFFYFAENIDCGHSLEPPSRGGTNLSRNMKNISLLSENFPVLVVKFSIYLNWRIFVIKSLNNKYPYYWIIYSKTRVCKALHCFADFQKFAVFRQNFQFVCYFLYPFSLHSSLNVLKT